MLKIGITGGIGSGKTFVCQILEKMGYPVFYSDQEAKKLMNTNQNLIENIQHLIGKNAYKNNQLNKEYIASKIFTEPDFRGKLNALVHPTVYSSFEIWASKQLNNIVFNESALLFETGSYKRFDKTILIISSYETRIKRIKSRDSIGKDEIDLRMKSQLNDTEKIKMADYIIENEEKKMILPEIITLLKKI
jgi:dephospho-CoA kinase